MGVRLPVGNRHGNGASRSFGVGDDWVDCHRRGYRLEGLQQGCVCRFQVSVRHRGFVRRFWRVRAWLDWLRFSPLTTGAVVV